MGTLNTPFELQRIEDRMNFHLFQMQRILIQPYIHRRSHRIFTLRPRTCPTRLRQGIFGNLVCCSHQDRWKFTAGMTLESRG